MATVCPRCGSKRIAPVIYTYASPEWRSVGFAAGRSADVYDDGGAPNWECSACRHRWPDPLRVRVAREVHEVYRRARADLSGVRPGSLGGAREGCP